MVYYYHHAHYTHPPTVAMDFPSYDKRASPPLWFGRLNVMLQAAADHATAAALTTLTTIILASSAPMRAYLSCIYLVIAEYHNVVICFLGFIYIISKTYLPYTSN